MSDSNRRRTERLFDYVVLGALTTIFIAILEVMSRQNIKPEVLTVLGGALGVDMTLIGTAASHLWGAPKRDGGPTAPAAPPPNPPGATSGAPQPPTS